MEPEKDVAIVRVTRGYDVHSLWHNNRNTYFIRVGHKAANPARRSLDGYFSNVGLFALNSAPYQVRLLPTWTAGGFEIISAVSVSRKCQTMQMNPVGRLCWSTARL